MLTLSVDNQTITLASGINYDAVSEAKVVAAQAAQTAAEVAQGLAETAQAAAELAETNAETAQAAAELAETNAETAQATTEAIAAQFGDVATAVSASQAAQAAAELAETNAETAQTAAEAAQATTEAITAQFGDVATAISAAQAAQSAAELAETNAETAQGLAETARTAAELAETNAQSAQTGAETAQGLAETAQVAAETAQGLAETAQAAAELAETNAETAETNAAGSASDADLSRQHAAEWANKAEDSLISAAAGGDQVDDYSALHHANKASASATAASGSAAAAAASYDAFDDRFLGAKSSAPTVDNDGQTLLTGALYWDTTIPALRVWTGSAWTDTTELDSRVLADQQLLGTLSHAIDMACHAAQDLVRIETSTSDSIAAIETSVGAYDAAIEASVYEIIHALDLAGVVARAISGGDVFLRAASASQPSLSTVGDRDTGLFFPAADVVALATAGLERLRVDANGRLGIGTNAPSGLLDVNDNKMRIRTAKTPSSATDTGSAGEICWDASYIYICTATNTWKRVAISSW